MSNEPGATGNFPMGKLVDDDEGELRVAVGDKDGKVIIEFGKPVAWLGLTPQGAVDFAQTLIQRAMAVGHDRPVQIAIGSRKR